MPSAQLTVSLPDEYWLGEVSRRPTVESVRIVSALKNDACVFHIVIRHEDSAGLREQLDSFPLVQQVEVLSEDSQMVSVFVEVTTDQLMAAANNTLGLIRFPVSIQNGIATMQVVGPHDRVAGLRDHLAGENWSVSLEKIQQSTETDSVLTPRQRELIEIALAHGYYQTPRKCTLTELAREIGIAKSSLSECLHRAEASVMTQFLDSQRSGLYAPPAGLI